MQAGPAKVNELFVRLSETSDGALKTRERLFADLRAELEAHVELEEQHLFPVLRKHAETKELVAGAIKENKELRAALNELDALPKNDGAFLGKLADLRKSFRQHARDEKKELLPAVQKALSEEQVQVIAEKMETSLAEAEQARLDQAEQRRAAAQQEREQADARQRQEAAAEREHQEQVEAQARAQEAAEREQRAVARRAREAALQTTEAVARSAQVAADNTREVTSSVAEGARQVAFEGARQVAAEGTRQVAAAASAAAPATGAMFWDMWLGMAGLQPGRAVASRGVNTPHADRGNREVSVRAAPGQEHVIQLAEEVLTIGTQKVSSGTTRVRRYVVETAVEKQVTLVRERVVVERRRPVTDRATGELLTELSVEVTETDEVPVVGKTVRLKEEVVVRTERSERIETVRGTVRQDEVEIEHSDDNVRARRRAPARA
jgi:stress response protein YsnF/hemerythrin-like domain-containing protein